MIKIKDKIDCCGCSACVQKCPKECISLKEDNEGFLYPEVDKGICIDCGLCDKVCPILHQGKPRKPIKVYAAKNKDEEIRRQSSSGGIFTLLAEQTIHEGGVVFGARFDENWEVKHDYTETIEGLAPFRGSKYVQSRMVDNYSKAERFLKQGRKVLFSGTPCQIAGFKRFLRKEYENLLTVDIVCHGVPSPLVWRKYLNELVGHSHGTIGKSIVSSSLKERPTISYISFRDKSTGWEKYSLIIRGNLVSKVDQNSNLLYANDVILHETHNQNLFMQLFLKDLCLRPSCRNCPSKSSKSGSDITIADYWGISNHHPKWDDDKGTSLILVNTLNGVKCFQKLDFEFEETLYEQALKGNPNLENSVVETKYVSLFWNTFIEKGIQGSYDILNSMGLSYFQRIKALVYRLSSRIKRMFVSIILLNLYFYL